MKSLLAKLRPRYVILALALAAALYMLTVALIRSRAVPPLATKTIHPVGVMGTECELTAVLPGDESLKTDAALSAAEAVLRDVEAHMSIHLPQTELSHLNDAPAGQAVELSPRTMEVLRLSRDLAAQSDGAFDVTCRPILQAWGRARQAGHMPTDAELDEACRLTGWEHLELLDGAVRKRQAAAGVDLGGIAKGYAVDLAVEAMIDAGAIGGVVNVGGNLRCFGRCADGDRWIVGVRSPFDRTLIATLAIADAGVCTSGNYQRFFEIGGKRYSHIVDPRTGRTADLTPSVTVVAPTAAVADGWATALSVLGVDGLRKIPPGSGIEAAIVLGEPENYQFVMTSGFERLLTERPVAKVTVYAPPPDQPTTKAVRGTIP